ncbi:MAG: hypothetical protein M1167_05205 [Chloroflexi bacterium]|nr:hypothetical protein [Chloroflexota bacterium]
MRTKTKVSLVLIFIISSLIIIEPAATQTSPPPVPKFTLKIEDNSYYVAPNTVDPHTGKTANATGYTVEVKFVDVVIQNTVPYTFYAVVNDSIVKLYYNIRYKAHTDDWANAMVTPNLAPLNSNYTTIKFGLGSTNPDPGGWSIWLGNLTSASQLDFQVSAVNGFYTKLTAENPPCWRIPSLSVFNETGRSAWSSTQTFSVPGS